MLEIILVLGPLFGAALVGFTHRLIGEWASMLITTGLVLLSCLLATILWIQVGFGDKQAYDILLAPWLHVGGFQSDWVVRVDTLSTTMMFLVTAVSSLVHIYSIGYMDHDRDKGRFFAYLSLFTFAMLMLVTARDFLQMFFGWEGVGLASYLLVGFWFEKQSANDAAIKAFVTNRVGDVGFALGIIACYQAFGSIAFDDIFAQLATAKTQNLNFMGVQAPLLEIIGVLLFVGAMGKSAQFLLHVWLPDAMEGPTPVSALIHAATMVTAGVFLVCRMSPLYAETIFASGMIAILGSITALFAASVALVQNDIKRVIAYSTCSQLGYMFFAAGVGLYNAAMFHLVTHAFFKAMLFLGAGAVIHGVHNEQDMRHMGGLARVMPITYALMLIGTLAITGVGIPHSHFGFAGFVSKDAILEGAYAVAQGSGSAFAYIAFLAGILAALMTAFYSWRLIFMTFHKEYRGALQDKHAPHESGWLLLGPLLPLGIGAVFAGALLYEPMMGKDKYQYWDGSLYVKSYAAKDKEYGRPPGRESEKQHVDTHNTSAGLTVASALTDTTALKIEPVDAATARAVNVELGDLSTAAADEMLADEQGAVKHSADGTEKHHKASKPHLPEWVVWSPTIAMLTGLILAILFYLRYPAVPARIGAQQGPFWRFLYYRWFMDHLYRLIFVRGSEKLGDLLWRWGDEKLIDGLGPNGVAALVMRGSKRASKLQSGYLYHYAFVMLIAVMILIALGLWAGGRAV